MTRLASAVALAGWLCPSWLYAQSAVLTVTVASADVYKSPSTGSPIIGHAPRGAILDVTRELGSWVKIAWSDAPDHVGYVHVTMGTVSPRSRREPSRSDATATAPDAASQPRASPARSGQPGAQEQAALTRPVYVTPSMHAIGFGGRADGSPIGVGGSVRAWRRDRWGMQLAVSRRTFSGSGTTGEASSTEVAPSVLYSLADRVTDSWWVRPYLGLGLSIQSLPGAATSGVSNATSERRLGLRVFGGGEVTFAGAPRFALSADVGYLRAQTGRAPVELGGIGMALSGHWYVK